MGPIDPLSNEAFERCIDGLYGALTRPDDLPAALASVRPIFDATGSAFIQADATGSLLLFVGQGHSPLSHRLFVERYHDLDPARPIVMARRPGHWLADDRLFDKRHAPRSEYVNEFAPIAGLRWFRGAKLHEDRHGSSFFSIQRPADAAPFDAETMARLDRMFPHLARVARLLGELGPTLPALAAGHATIEGLATGLCVVDATCRLHYANPAAEAIFAQPAVLGVRHGQLTSPRASVRDRLRTAVAGATRYPCVADAFSPNPEEPLLARCQVRVTPLNTTLPIADSARGRMALLFITCGPDALRPGELMQLFGLTRAEAELVALLAHGLTPAECADRRGVSHATVRTQLASAYMKTGVVSQAQLLALADALPALQEPSRP